MRGIRPVIATGRMGFGALTVVLTVAAALLGGCGEQDLYKPPQSPIQVIGRLPLPSVVEGVSVLGTHAYVAGGEGGLYVVDIANPSAPVLTQIIKTTKYAYAIETASTPFRGGVVDISFVVEGTEGVTSYDVTRPDSVSSLEQGSDSRDAEGIFLELPEDPVNPYIIYVPDNYHGLLVFESDESAPGVFRNRVLGATRGYAKAVSVVDGFAYVADDEMGLAVVDVRVRVLGSIQLVAYADTPGNARAIDVKDGYAYIADGLNGLVVMQVDRDATPIPVGHLPLPGLCRSITVREGRAYLAAQDGGIHIVDVSNPTNPSLAGRVPTTYATDVVVSSSGLVVASDKVEGLLILGGEVPVQDDTTPPARVVDLQATPLSSATMRLDWHAPGGDLYEGVAAQYDVRRSQSPITTETWESAIPVDGEPLPSQGGTPESFVVTGLETATEYFFALRAVDQASNWSPISNVASDTTYAGTTLTGASVSPGAGAPGALFTFEVTYSDGDGDVPVRSDVMVSGTRYGMAKVGGDYREGALFRAQVNLDRGVYETSFDFDDGNGHVVTTTPVAGPYVGEVVLLGSPAGELGRDSDEAIHTVVLTRDYLIEDHEVTQAEYESAMHTNPSMHANPDGPVENVTWFDAIAYCNARSTLAGLTPAYTVNGDAVAWDREADGFRLPTEAEWERSCRAGTATAFSAGSITYEMCEVDAVLDPIGWYCGNAGSGPHPVKGKAPNPWNLYDMHGNVWEYCWDWYEVPSGGISPDGGPTTGMQRVIRGGSWYYYARDCRSASRAPYWPNSKDDIVGFRVARTIRSN
jgi:formylglycine-generating enzyme required for sulfatase activity